MTRVSLFRRRTDKALPQLDVDSPVMPCRPSFSTHAHAAPRLVRGSKTETVAARRSSLRSSTGGSSCSTRGGSPQRSNSPDVNSIRSFSKGSSQSSGTAPTVLFGGKVLHQGDKGSTPSTRASRDRSSRRSATSTSSSASSGCLRSDSAPSPSGGWRDSDVGSKEDAVFPRSPASPASGPASRRSSEVSAVPSAEEMMAAIEREDAAEMLERRRQSLDQQFKTSEDLDDEFEKMFSSPQFKEASSARESAQASANLEDWRQDEHAGKTGQFIDSLLDVEVAKQEARSSAQAPASPAGGKTKKSNADSVLGHAMQRVRTKLAAIKAFNLCTGDLERDAQIVQEMQLREQRQASRRGLARTRSAMPAMPAAPASPRTPSRVGAREA